MLQILEIAGYSNSGKTSTIKAIHNRLPHAEIVSNSNTIHHLVSKTEGRQIDTRNSPYDRNRCIWMAEEVIVPLIGRVGLCRMSFSRIKLDSSLVIVEVFNNEELKGFRRVYQERLGDEPYDTITVNLRSEDEYPEVDLRELIPDGLHYWATPDMNIRVDEIIHLLSDSTEDNGFTTS